MATLDRSSPSLFQGLSWDEWATTVAQDASKGKLQIFRYRSGRKFDRFVVSSVCYFGLNYVFDSMFSRYVHLTCITDATEGDGESQEVLQEEETHRKRNTCQVMRLKREGILFI